MIGNCTGNSTFTQIKVKTTKINDKQSRDARLRSCEVGDDRVKMGSGARGRQVQTGGSEGNQQIPQKKVPNKYPTNTRQIPNDHPKKYQQKSTQSSSPRI